MLKIGSLVIQPLCLTLSCLWLISCGGSDSGSPLPPSGATPSPTITASPAPTNSPEPTVSASPSPTPTPSPIFSADEARANLQWAKSQAITMLGKLESGDDLILPRQCLADDVVCFPRAVDDGKIQMSQPSQWTNGFWPGILWKLLNARAEINDFSDAEAETLLTHAMSYSEALFSEAERTTTHDLGFILYDSLGEALDNVELSDEDRATYTERLSRGRESLASRYNDEVGLIKSWDWTPRFRTSYLDNGSEERDTFDLAAPWQYPVIVDNMMNLEFLLSGTVERHKTIALSHAQKTFENHYHYAADDSAQERPIAYHVFDYDSMRPGNWQGLGNVSAWARGQGWSLYGFVSVAEFLKDSTSAGDNPDYLAFADRLVNAIEQLMGDQYVPAWDFFASDEDAPAIAANTDASTTRYSRILDLCDYQIADTILPYSAYGPVEFPTDILAEASVTELASYRSVADEDLIVGDTVVPCGTSPYDLTGRQIPKDSSAAALIASGLYRLAQLSDDTDKRARYIDLGDKIMKALSADYLARAGASFELGFTLNQATGNLPGGSEIDTGIIYADFYFIEANIRRLQL